MQNKEQYKLNFEFSLKSSEYLDALEHTSTPRTQ